MSEVISRSEASDVVEPHRAGFVIITGRPNVGKSTLLNRILGTKLAIVTPKPQTTRHRILGIKSGPHSQMLFVDTPGVHQASTLLGQRMVDVARKSLTGADVVVFLLDAKDGLTSEDRGLVEQLERYRDRLIVGLNKLDRVSRAELLVTAAQLAEILPDVPVVPISARDGSNLEELLSVVGARLPISPALFPADAQTDLPERFFAAEIVREQVFLHTHEEVPYQTAVRIDSFVEAEGRGDRGLLEIHGTILVARESQKAIVIGEGGQRIKRIGQAARLELERFFGLKVYLRMMVKLDRQWFANPRTLGELGL